MVPGMRDFAGRTAVVTGAGSGIGRALAHRFAAERMKVVLADVEAAPLAAVEAELREKGTTTLAVRTDVSRAADVEALARRTIETFDAVHVLCNNAGVFSAGPSWELSLADWEWVLGVNLWGVIHGVRTFVPIMLRQDTEAHVVNTASMAGLLASPYSAIYNVTKFGVVALSESLQQELAIVNAKVRVSVLCPAWVNTNIADADRNRPADAPPPRALTPEQQAMQEVGRQMLASGLAPERVADIVLDAIRAERFYVLTHPEWKVAVRERMENILEDRTPGVGSFV